MSRPDFSAPSSASARHLPTELLRRYVAGELSAPQEHAVEAHTLECEQCAEVLEGLEMQPAAVTDASLAELRLRLQTRLAELADEAPAGVVVRPLWWQSMAAAAMLLLTLGTVTWLILRPAARPEMATRTSQMTEKARRTATSTVAPAEPAAETADLAAAPAPEVASALPRTRPVRPAASSAADLAVVSAARPVVQANRTEVADATAAAEVAGVAKATATSDAAADAASPTSYATTSAPPAATDPLAASSRRAKQVETARAFRTEAAPVPGPGRTVQGRIVDTAGQPLPGATVLVPGSGTGVRTSADGRFALTVPPGSRQLAVSSIGYTTQLRFLQASDSTLTLALAPDSKQLSEVVVRREAPPGMPSLGPLPAGGYAAFRQYLRDSLDYPEKARDQKLQGTVRLRFVVEADGQLSDIKVVRRLSPECDEEAMRLLKEGPTWFSGVQNNRRTARKVELNVSFSLEK